MRISSREDALRGYWAVSLAVNGYIPMTVYDALRRLSAVEAFLYSVYPQPYGLLKRIYILQDRIIFKPETKEVDEYGQAQS